MKNLLLFVFIFGLTQASAQIPNSGFENMNPDGSISHWGNVYLMAISIDSSGNASVDSILFDNAYYFLTTDAHSGITAVEMRNSYNITSGMGRAGSVSNDSDFVYSAWGSFEMVPTLVQPVQLEFYYKYFPVNGDTAIGHLQVFDSNGIQIGEASAIITGTVSSFTLASVPVVYSSPDVAAFYSLNFSTAIIGSEPWFGTRFIVDDVSFDTVTMLEETENQESFTVMPNPASDFISFHKPLQSGNVRIFDSLGNLVAFENITTSISQLSVQHLSAGVYHLEVIDGNSTERSNFVIVR